MKKISGVIKSLINACPYSMVGKKCFSAISGTKVKRQISNNKILRFRNGIKTGTKISLIGIFCPFLWYSILTGQSENFIFLNVIHSGIIVSIGMLIVILNYLALIFYKKKFAE
ncbi:hypothetical protein J1D01_12665 [Seonamhaeicola sp. NFXS20]|uniref:hypothetical protein n=1 Tax=unclassified Seonamhaeicola TaxID=2622645 RepID=UPI0035655B06